MTDFDDECDDPPKTLLDYLSRDTLDDLWGFGYTVIKRPIDPYDGPPIKPPHGMAYQWEDRKAIKTGWRPVPASRHDGWFCPAGYMGDCEVGSLVLCERPKAEVDAAIKDNINAAYKLTDDWMKKYGGAFSGSVTIGTQTRLGELDTVTKIEVGDKTLEDASGIPADMMHRTAEIFAERDRLGKDYAAGGDETKWAFAPFQTHILENHDAKLWPTLNALLLPTAIENVRKKQVRLLTAIPRELTPHILTIMAERDRILMDEEASNGPYKSEADLVNARNAALLSAIETIRNSLKEPSDGQAS